MIDTISLAAMHIALGLLLLQFTRREDPEDQRRKPFRRFGTKRDV